MLTVPPTNNYKLMATKKEVSHIMKIYLSIALLAIFACVTLRFQRMIWLSIRDPQTPVGFPIKPFRKTSKSLKMTQGSKPYLTASKISATAMRSVMILHSRNGLSSIPITVSRMFLILACGTCPSGLYEFPNKDPDGSNVENFVEAGNVVINVADWIFYMSYEGGVRSPNNGAQGSCQCF